MLAEALWVFAMVDLTLIRLGRRRLMDRLPKGDWVL
jgi:hypothetical protein